MYLQLTQMQIEGIDYIIKNAHRIYLYSNKLTEDIHFKQLGIVLKFKFVNSTQEYIFSIENISTGENYDLSKISLDYIGNEMSPCGGLNIGVNLSAYSSRNRPTEIIYRRI